MGQTLDIDTANEEVMLWLDNVAHQRIHDTTKQKPSERIIEEHQSLQTLPPKLVNVIPTVALEGSAAGSIVAKSQQPIHHSLSVYDQLMEVI